MLFARRELCRICTSPRYVRHLPPVGRRHLATLHGSKQRSRVAPRTMPLGLLLRRHRKFFSVSPTGKV